MLPKQTHELGSSYHQIGRVHQENREWERALENYRLAIGWKEKTKQMHELGGSYHQIGMVHQENREWERALENRQRAAVLGELAGMPTAVLAEQLDTNTNALYKLHHDARLRLRVALEERGFSETDVRGIDPTHWAMSW